MRLGEAIEIMPVGSAVRRTSNPEVKYYLNDTMPIYFQVGSDANRVAEDWEVCPRDSTYDLSLYDALLELTSKYGIDSVTNTILWIKRNKKEGE
jgi:hypothetical protein